MNEEIHKNQMQIHHYIIEPNIISQGGFGIIYRGQHKRTKEPVAIKMEHHANTTLRHETRMLQYLHENNVRNIPKIYWFGIHSICKQAIEEKFQVLILPFFHCNLETYLQYKRPSSSLHLVTIAMKCLDILQHIHTKFVVHRDIKPANFMIKNGDIYLIDFGLATFYVDENRDLLKDYSQVGKDIGSMIGTVKYASIHIHRGHRYTRRDDLISLVNMYDSMINGIPNMPTESFIGRGGGGEERTDISHPLNQQWMYIKKQYLLELEIQTPQSSLYDIYKYVYSIKYYETPDYAKMKSLFYVGV